MVAVSADDYAWFTEQCAELADAYCLTLVRGRTPGEVIEALGGTDPIRITGVGRVPEAAEARGGRLVAVTGLDGWTLIVEPGGDLAAGDGAVRLLSRGTVLVSHCYRAQAEARFVWARDGEVLLEFDPSGPGPRRGTGADGVAGVLEQLGFDPGAEEPDAADPDGADAEWTSDDARHRERALALAGHLTGVRITLEALEAATFSCATLPNPRGAGQPDPRHAPIPGPRARPAASTGAWDEEYDADEDEDDYSRKDGDAEADEGEEGDAEEREWPRLKAMARRVFG